MRKNIQRIGVGRFNAPGVDEDTSVIDPVAGIFTFDSATVTFDSMVDTFDFDIIPLPPVVKKDYAVEDYSSDYK